MKSSVQIAVNMDDGTLTILTFATASRSPTLPVGASWDNKEEGTWIRHPVQETVDAELAKAFPPVNGIGLANPQPVSWAVVDPKAVPADRTYRNAWRHDGRAFSHDLGHAKEIHADILRRRRTALLGELDKDWIQAMGADDKATAASVEAQKVALRDVTDDPRIAAASTVEELKALLDEQLTSIGVVSAVSATR